MFVVTTKRFNISREELKRALRVPQRSRIESIEVQRTGERDEPYEVTVLVRLPHKTRRLT